MTFRKVSTAERENTPYSAIGLLNVLWKDGSRSSGSASVVGINDILTATHVVYNPDRGGWAKELEFFFGADYSHSLGDFTSYGTQLTSGFEWEAKAGIEGTFADSDNQTLLSSEAQFDIALIGVSIPIGEQTGWLGLDPGRSYAQTVNTAGYPRGASGLMTERVTVDPHPRWGIYQGISQMDRGSSGGPLFTDDGYVIGVTASSSGPGTRTNWADLGFSWHWIKPFMDENNAMLAREEESALVTLRASQGESSIAFLQLLSAARLSQDSNGTWTVSLQGGRSSRLEGYTRLEFLDKTVALDTEAVAGQAYRIYKAAFNRVPDHVGLGYWIAQMDAGMGIVEVSSRFIDSTEFQSVYGSNPSDPVFLTRVYQNTLGRDPEPLGFDWWISEMRTNPEKTRAKVLADFSESFENKTAVASLITDGIVFTPYLAPEGPTQTLSQSEPLLTKPMNLEIETIGLEAVTDLVSVVGIYDSLQLL